MSAPMPATAVPSADRTTHGVRSGALAVDVGGDAGAGAADADDGDVCVPGVCVPGASDGDGSGDGNVDGVGSGSGRGGGADRTPRRIVKPRRSPNATIHATLIFFLRAGTRSL